MDAIWQEMLQAARAVRNGRQLSDYVSCGEVAAEWWIKPGVAKK